MYALYSNQTVISFTELGKKKKHFVCFVGPDGIGDYRTKQHDSPRFIGIGPLSPESSADLDYLFRAAPGTMPPLSKDGYVCGVGWGLEYSFALNARTLLSDNQFKVAYPITLFRPRENIRYVRYFVLTNLI